MSGFLELVVITLIGLALIAKFLAFRERERFVRLNADIEAAIADIEQRVHDFDNPELPEELREHLALMAERSSSTCTALRLQGQLLADRMRRTLSAMPDTAMASVLYYTLGALNKLEIFALANTLDPFDTATTVLTAAAVELSSLDRELAA